MKILMLEEKTVFALCVWFLTHIYQAIRALSCWRRERGIVLVGKNVFYSSCLNQHQYIAVFIIFIISVTMGPYSIPHNEHLTSLYVLIFNYFFFLQLNHSSSQFVFAYPHYAMRIQPITCYQSCSIDVSLSFPFHMGVSAVLREWHSSYLHQTASAIRNATHVRDSRQKQRHLASN